MTYDPELAKAEIRAAIIRIQHHIRQSRRRGDLGVLEYLVQGCSEIHKGSKDAKELVYRRWYQENTNKWTLDELRDYLLRQREKLSSDYEWQSGLPYVEVKGKGVKILQMDGIDARLRDTI